jgi:uncharacterized protein (UPF0210 family)
MTHTVVILKETATGIIREAVREVPEEMIQSVKEAAKLTAQTGDMVTFEVH